MNVHLPWEPVLTPVWPWLVLAGLGAFHGLNPAMGWLFAAALGLQRRSRGAVLWSLLPIALGHALSIGLVVLAVGVLRAFVDLTLLRVGSAVAILGFGLYRLVARHRTSKGMQVTGADLVLWSFLMATAHGAGLMLVPVLFHLPIGAPAHHHEHLGALDAVERSSALGLAAVGVHTLAMLVVSGAVALVVYQWAGRAFPRRAWLDLDLVWALALIGVGVILLVTAVP